MPKSCFGGMALGRRGKIQVLLLFVLSMAVSACTSQVADEAKPSKENQSVEPSDDGNAKFCVSATGMTVPDGGTLEVYSAESAPCGSSCPSLKGSVSCTKGQLSGDVDFKFSSCVAQPCRCKYGSLLLNEGTETPFYKIATGACEQPEQHCNHASNMAMVKCLPGGVLEGPDPSEFPYRSCSMPTCYCELPSGIKIPRGSTNRTVYSKAEAGCDETCSSLIGYVTCDNNGLLSGDIAKAQSLSCSPKKCSCDLPIPITIAYKAKMSLFKIDKAPCGIKCSDNVGEVSCMTPGVPTGNPAEAIDYKYTTCLQEGCEGEGGGSGGGQGNSKGPGQGWFGGGDGGGGIGGPATANSIAFVQPGCSTPWDAATDTYRKPGTHKGRISEGSRVVAFKKATVACGETCTQNSIVRTCINGRLSGSDAYIYGECQNTCK